MPSEPLLDALRRVITNDLPTSLPSRVAFIIGSNPSKGARSPKLWNAAFAAMGIDATMFPLDVKTDCLSSVIDALEAEPGVVGAAIAAPHKSDAARWCGDRLSASARRGGAVNVLSRRDDGRFVGNNTDGLGALESLREIRDRLEDCRFLVLGCGGTGRAVISALLDVVKPSRISVAVRGVSQHDWLRGMGVEQRSYVFGDLGLAEYDIVINCTTVGWGEQSNSSPLNEKQIAVLRGDAVVFDVVYQPDPTRLLELASARGLRTLSGSRMNLLQAVLAFTLCVPSASREIVVSSMSCAASV